MGKTIYDVAIIGGGVAGIYAGWRLIHDNLGGSETLRPLAAARSNGKLKVAIFERSPRLGGRIESISPPDMPTLKAEVGGMRFIANQRLVSNLIAELGLPTTPFAVNRPENIYYLRGKHFRESDFTEPDKIPYNLAWLEKGKKPGQIILEAIEQVVPGGSKLKPAQWSKIKKSAKFNGEYLYKQGFWNVLMQVMSSEAYQLCLDAGGYLSPLNNWNAADAMQFFLADFGPGATYMSVVGGYQRLPDTLAAQYAAAGGETHLCKPALGFEKVDGAGDENDPKLKVHFGDGSSILARHLILAMPRRSLELLRQQNGFFNAPTVKELIPTVTPQGMFKIFLAYRYPWWELTGVEQGKSNTDLPIRQTYYFGKEASADPANPAIQNALMMASYNDLRFVGFWEGLQEPDWKSAHECPPDEGKTPWERHAAPPAMIAEVQRQLRLLHDLETVPQPYAAAFKDWREEPYGGAWNSWNIGVKSWEVYEKMLQPLADWQVYICGDCYSYASGWVEGALQTSEELLEEKLELARPDWLSWS